MSDPSSAPGTPFDSITEPDPPSQLTPAATPTAEAAAFVQQIKETADKLVSDRAGRGDVKLLATALKELRYCLKVFAAYRGRRKVTVFGSARTRPDHPAYQAAVEFGRQIRERGYMVITGAAAGIMEAGHVGAGRDHSFGLNIILPFEQAANPVIHGDPKLMNLRYFFTRKLMFIKESDAVVLFPGGFGTHDEAFETLTLIQTGKTHIFPIVLVDEPGGTYWQRWQQFVKDELLDRRYISPDDLSLYRVTDSVEEAVEEVDRFYRVYHSMRYVRGSLVLRLRRVPSEATLEKIRAEFRDILTAGTFEVTDALPQEANEPTLAELPRLRFKFNRHSHGRLRQLIDVLNRDGE
ncbi:MAG: TIGR00730 family Rossman fold protein [Gemmataceae bacterium]